MTTFALDGMDLAALLCSRVCHDTISPVGAIINGLEVLEEEKEPEMRQFALDLIKKSAATASARLQFCRLAYGAAGSAGAAWFASAFIARIWPPDCEVSSARLSPCSKN